MNSKLFLCLLYLLLLSTSGKSQDTLYFDKDWNPSTKENYEFYRPMPLKKIGNLFYIQDFYKNGNLQMQGYALADNPEVYVGDMYWYDEDGFDSSIRQHRNKTSQNELTYYNTDGSLWQTIKYNAKGDKQQINTFVKGKVVLTGYIDTLKKLSGTFTSDFYTSYEQNTYEDTGESEGPTPTVAETRTAPPLKKNTTTFKIIKLWQNGLKASETTYNYTEYGTPERQYSRSWTADGKLISEINHASLRNGNGEVYQDVGFYTQNNFATAIKGIAPTKNNSRHGLSIYYYPNGNKQTEEKYTEGVVQEIRFYNQDGTLDTISTYKDAAPFDGKFSDQHGNKEIVYSMSNGIKQGRVYVRDIDQNEILFEGQYKDGNPLDGYFMIFERGYPEKLHYIHGLQEGLQANYVYLDADGQVLSEEYEMKNGVRDGFRKIYRDGKLKYESTYKNGEPYSGTISEYPKQSTFENGHLSEVRHFGKYDYDNPIYVEKYTADTLSTVAYYDFTISEQPHESYQGIYKNGKPYEGYFKLDTLIDDIPLIHYYEKGTKVYMYSFELLEQLESYQHYTYTHKTVYQNDQAIDGPVYRLIGGERLMTTYYEQAKPVRFDVNLFAMHYFNRITFDIQPTGLSISEVQSSIKLKIAVEGTSMTAKLYEGDKLVLHSGLVRYTPKEASPHSVTVFYTENDQVKKFISTMDTLSEKINEITAEQSILYPLFYLFPIADDTNLDALFNHFLANFKKENLDEAFEMNINNDIPVNDDNYITSLEYDTLGRAYAGIDILPQKDNSFILKAIHEGKIVETISVNSLEELLADNKAILTKMQDKLWKM